VERKDERTFEITDLATGQKSTLDIRDYRVDHGALVKFKADGDEKLLQFIESKDGQKYSFYYKGNTVDIMVYD